MTGYDAAMTAMPAMFEAAIALFIPLALAETIVVVARAHRTGHSESSPFGTAADRRHVTKSMADAGACGVVAERARAAGVWSLVRGEMADITVVYKSSDQGLSTQDGCNYLF